MVQAVGVEQLRFENFDHYWPRIEACLDAEPDLWKYDFTKESLQAGIKAGFFQLWAVGDQKRITLLLLTEVRETPVCRVLHVKWIFGSGLFSEYLDTVDDFVDNLAQVLKAERIEAEGPEAWKRVMRGRGIKVMSLRYTRPVPKPKRRN